VAKSQFPIDGKMGKEWKITSPFGWRIHPIEKYKKHHNGVDIWGPASKIYCEAWHDGRVIAAGTSKLKNKDGSLGGVGWYVDVRSKVDGKLYVARYAHMVPNSLKVKKGQLVKAGDVLGIMGTSGASTGKHLHFEICEGKTHKWTSDGKGFVNPLEFIKLVMKQEKMKADAPKATPSNAPITEMPLDHEAVAQAAPVEEAPIKAPAKVAAKPVTYKVVSGDTLGKIAARFGTTTKELMSLNKISNANLIRIGQTLTITSTSKAPAVKPKPVAQHATPALAPAAKKTSAPKPEDNSELHPMLAKKGIKPGTVEAVLALAKHFVDLKYVEGPKKDTIFGKFMGLNYAPWCASFVSYVFNKSGSGSLVKGVQTAKGYVGCTAGINGLKTKKGFKSVPLAQAQPGDIIFFDWQNDNDPDHTGIVLKNNPKKKIVTCYEGNTSAGPGSQSNGGGVYKRDRAYGLVHVVIRPVYKKTSDPKPATPSATGTNPTA
jgi:murein DD-endopeptidase MepM/ murein hydrolase activator NlpD